jgi:glucose-1-phosphate cytidylyltransferase
MKVVILAGGLGTRLSEETEVKPKPMVQIGGMPILWHIMKIYSHYGFNEFIICLGYKGYIIKEYFSNYFLHKSDVTIDLQTNSFQHHISDTEPWKISMIDTGVDSMTGGRIKRIQKYVGNERFMLTYGDGVSNINIPELIRCHDKNKSFCTLSAVHPPARFGALEIQEDNKVEKFFEKPKGDGTWINGGFMVCEPEVFNYIENDTTIWEQDSLPRLAEDKQLSVFKHDGFWRPMDTLNDKYTLNKYWEEGTPLWKIWN